MLVEVNYDNLYCFACRSKMVEVTPYHHYQCYCGGRYFADEVTAAQWLSGWEICPDCEGQQCEHCGFLGVLLPISQEG